jgi:hypothetical protein
MGAWAAEEKSKKGVSPRQSDNYGAKGVERFGGCCDYGVGFHI